MLLHVLISLPFHRFPVGLLLHHHHHVHLRYIKLPGPVIRPL